MCRVCVSRRWDSAIAVLGGSDPTWKADKARLLVGGHKVRKLGFRRSHSRCAAMTGAGGPKALPSGGQDLSCQSTEHDGDALVMLFQSEAPLWSEVVCVCRCAGSSRLLIACLRYPRLQLVFCFQPN